MPRRQLPTPTKPKGLNVSEHAIPIQLGNPDSNIKPTITLFPSSFTSITACNYLKYRVLQGKYKIGLPSTPSEQQSLDRLYRKVSRELSEMTISTSLKRPDTPDGFFVVDMENGNVSASTPSQSIEKHLEQKNKMNCFQHFETIIIRFPLYLLFIFFLFIYDIIVDGKFRLHVRNTITLKCNSEDE